MKNTRLLIDVAAGRALADLVFKNASVVNVFTGEIYQTDVAVTGGYIAGLGQYVGKQEIDCTGQFICPGFIDAHLHIESTMVLPGELVRKTLPFGTTTYIADPHEIVNVCGAQGMQFMLDATENLPANIYFMLPSSVPASPFETAGAAFTAADMEPFLQHPRVLGLGEVMGYPDVIAAADTSLEKIALFENLNRPVDGHAPSVAGKDLQAYRAAGVETEHESTSFAEALEKARAGFGVLVREGSAAHNLVSIVTGLTEKRLPTNRFLFCTDDKHLEDIEIDGHISWNVKLAIETGLNPVDAIRMASWNAALQYGLRDVGAVAPGYKADLILLDSLKQVEIAAVYKDGIPAETRLENISSFTIKDSPILQSVHIPELTKSALQLPIEENTHVIEMVPYQLNTKHLLEPVPQTDGLFQPTGEYNKLCVVERHGKNGNIALGVLKGYGIQEGAIATTVAHDSHNIIAVGDHDEDILRAIERLNEIQGGFVLVKSGEVVGEVPLQVAGLMSTDTAENTQRAIHDISKKAAEMGIPYYIDPFISLSFLALPVIPALRLTDKGLFDVEKFALL